MFPVQLLTLMLASVMGLQYVYSEPVNAVAKSTVNPPGCGIRKLGSVSPPLGPAQQLSVEDEMMYDDAGMESRVIGGKTSTVQWPWMVGIIDEGYHACGGSVIDDYHVLTAAHCFDESTDPKNFEARIGELVQGESAKSYAIESIKIHEEYTGGPVYFNDIALLRLAEPIPKDAVPICLPANEALREGDTLTIIGFGATEEGGEASYTLQEVHNLPVIATKTCDKIIRSLSPSLEGVRKAQICTGDEKGGKSSCQGDSGGPVTFEESGRWFLLGLVSYSAGCARPGIPTVHTRISAYRDWIDRSIARERNVKGKGRKKDFKKMFDWL